MISPLIPVCWQGKFGKSGNTTLIKRNMIKDASKISHYTIEDFCLFTIIDDNLALFNIHLDDLHPQTRHKQINMLRSLCEKYKYCIMAGDYNQEYEDKSKLYDIKDMKIHNNKCLSYYASSKMNIDNILTKGFKKMKDIECPYVPENRTDGLLHYGSDHLPILVEIKDRLIF